MAGRFLGWYRRYYLLINIPALFLITELAMAHFDLARRNPSDLDRAFAHLAAHPPGNTPAILLLGNSGTLFGIDEDQLERSLSSPSRPLRVFNFGIAAARIDDVEQLTDLLLERGLKPRAVVLGINPFLVDDRVNSDSVFPWLHRRSPYIYFHRSRLRGLLKKLLRSSVDNPEEFGLAGTNLIQTDSQREFGVESFLREFAHRSVDDFAMLEEIPRFLASLAERKIPVFVVVLPLSPDGTKRLDNYASLIAAVRSQVPAGSLDLVEAYPYTSFKDVGHTNSVGRQQLTDQVSRWLATKPEVTAP